MALLGLFLTSSYSTNTVPETILGAGKSGSEKSLTSWSLQLSRKRRIITQMSGINERKKNKIGQRHGARGLLRESRFEVRTFEQSEGASCG